MKIFKHISSLLSSLRHNTEINPMRDWLMLLTGSTIALIGIVVWNAWAFDTVSSGGVIGSPATSTPAIFDRASIDNIRTIFENRATEAAKYKTGVYRFTDPSQ